MNRTKSKRQTRRGRNSAGRQELQVPILAIEPKRVRGVKLKHVSAFTMLLSVLCLCAFLLGRVDAVPAAPQDHGPKVRRWQPAESATSPVQQCAAGSSQLRIRRQI
jgi:hypothetical protein